MYILTQIQYSTTTNVNYDTMNHNIGYLHTNVLKVQSPKQPL